MALGVHVAMYLLVTLVTGLAAGRLIHNSGDFINAGRRLPFMLSSLALFALWYGSETVFGASAAFIEGGVLGIIEDPFGGFLCLLLFGLLLVRPLYRRRLLTLGDLFRQAYGARTEYLASVCMILTFVGYIAAQLVALGLLLETVFAVDPVTGRLLSAALVTACTAVGGMWAVSVTDFVQSIVIIVGLGLLALYFSAEVDTALLFSARPAGFFDLVPRAGALADWLDYTAAWMTLGLGSLASQDIFQRANAARSERVAVCSTLFGAVLYLVFALLPLYLVLVMFQLEPALAEGAGQNALLQLVAGHAPFWLQVLFYGALISAVFSTCSGALLAPATILAENFIKPLWLAPGDDRALLRASRLSVVVMACCAVALTFVSDDIYALVGESSILGAVSILIPMLFALFAKQHSACGAQLALVLGLVAYLLAAYAVDAGPVPPMFVGMAASLGGMLLGRRFSPATS